MDRFHIDSSKMLPRTTPEAIPTGLFPLLNASALGAHPGGTGFPFAPGSMTLARLSCSPCFNRRLFSPPGAGGPPQRPKDSPLGSGQPTGQLTNYMEWGQLHLDLDRFSQRYQLNPGASTKSGSKPSSIPQPEDLSVKNEDNIQVSCSEEEDEEDMEEEDSETSKSPALKFSIDAILGGCTKPKKKSCVERRNSSPVIGPILDVEDPDHNDDPEDLPADLDHERGFEGMMAEGERFSWLQCTRYKPPKLPRSKKKDGTKKRKLGRNPRVPFTQHQVNVLEQKFRQTHYLSSVDVAELSAALNLTETRVKIWFQNRRARERRDRENIQLLQGGPAAAAAAAAVQGGPKPKSSPSGMVALPDRLSPDGTLHRSPRDQASPGSSGLLSTGHLSGGPGLGFGGMNNPHAVWSTPLVPKPGMIGPFTGVQSRTSAFTPVSYFSYT